jgi:pimeloyl-ACP methyl ester carboxylesterase
MRLSRRFTIAALALAGALSMGLAALASATEAPSKHPLPPGGRYAELRGIRMYYEIHGRGSTVFLLHGGAGNGGQFSKQLSAFEKSHRVIVPDACGQGRSSGRSGALNFRDMAEDVAALMDLLGVRSADVMGWSDGGNTGLELAIRHPDRVMHLVTLGANFSPEGMNPSDRSWADTATAASFGDGMKRGWQQLSPEPERYEERMNQIIALWRTEPHFTPAELGSIRSPVLVIAGEHDVVQEAHTRALAAAIPGARLWIVPDASHSVMMEQPELVNRTVLQFFGAGQVKPHL